MGRSWRTWPCMPFSSARASLTLTRPGGASIVGESQPTAEGALPQPPLIPREGWGENGGNRFGQGVEVGGGTGVGW